MSHIYSFATSIFFSCFVLEISSFKTRLTSANEDQVWKIYFLETGIYTYISTNLFKIIRANFYFEQSLLFINSKDTTVKIIELVIYLKNYKLRNSVQV
jgi:hypothetical protein